MEHHERVWRCQVCKWSHNFWMKHFRENAIFKMLPSLCWSHRYLQLDAQLRVVAGLVVPDRQTHTHRPSTVTLVHVCRGLNTIVPLFPSTVIDCTFSSLATFIIPLYLRHYNVIGRGCVSVRASLVRYSEAETSLYVYCEVILHHHQICMSWVFDFYAAVLIHLA